MTKNNNLYSIIPNFSIKFLVSSFLHENSVESLHSIMGISTSPILFVYSCIWLGISIFFVAMFGLLFGYNDLIRLLITFEVFFLSSIIIFSFTSFVYLSDDGYAFALILLAVAAVETGIGLALLIRAHRLYKSIKIIDYNKLRAK